MSEPSQRSPGRKLQVVLSVLRGELSVAEAARRVGVAEQTVHNWKNAFFQLCVRAWRGRSGGTGRGGRRGSRCSRRRTKS